MASVSDADGVNLPGYKLCGYFIAVLSVSPPQTLAPLSPVTLITGAPKLIGFRLFSESESETLLLPIPNPNNETLRSSAKKKRGVNGSISIVRQMHALVMNGCLKIKARGLRVVFKGEREGEARAAVLVDVYLPVKAWEGWQFPRQGVLTGSFFKHVSCDWEIRSSLLALDKNINAHHHIDDERIWSCSDCHVLGCVMHGITSSASNRSFDLYEVFKSLPIVEKEEMPHSTRLKPENASQSPGIWDLADDVLAKVLTILGPKDLIRVAATCHHFRALAASVMPRMKLKLFPHQEAAVDWMWKREHNAEVLSHPLYMSFSTEDGFPLYINAVSGEISSGAAPTINDFRGGMFCDEPGLGKTVTALCLILKTHGTLAEPPPGVDVVWCINDADRRCGYYEISADNFNTANFNPIWKRFMGQNFRRGEGSPPEVSSFGISKSSPERRGRSMMNPVNPSASSVVHSGISTCKSAPVMPATHVLRYTQNWSHIKRNLLDTYGKTVGHRSKRKAVESSISIAGSLVATQTNAMLDTSNKNNKKQRKDNVGSTVSSQIWVQCDGCSKWRKLFERSILDSSMAWFCSMNTDPLHQSCHAPEEPSNYEEKITFYPGFYTKGTPQGQDHNVQFFINALKGHSTLLNSRTMKALTWLANLSPNQLLEMETIGLRCPVDLDTQFHSGKNGPGYYMMFQELGLVRKGDRSTRRWFYPPVLNNSNMSFDLTALKIALTKPLDLFRLYLSGATLIVVPANLIDHWTNQIQKHVRPGQLRVYVWNGNKKPCAHNLAWDYDIVITTFSRLSTEWGLRKRSILTQVHWLRVMLDEGHTLGSSLNLTNKLQMAISLVATNRWILTGTPTPYTPTSQVGHLQSMLKFLHEEAYGQNQESWEAGILRPFEAQMDEGRFRLMVLLRRIMISARKTDLRNIPPCIKKAVYLHFNEEHARSYNELVVTVRRNILMADWNDPSHVESLLNPKQWKFRSNTIRNIRLSCCVAGHIKVTDAGQDIQETMDILVQQGLDPLSEEYTFIKSSLLHGSSCFRCKDWCRLPVITPCRHFLCLDCVALDSEKCTYPGCSNRYEMQSPEILRRPENPNPKWPVPKDLIELQPSYEQDNWDPDWQSTSSSKVAYLVDKLKDLQESSRKIGYYEDSIRGREIHLYPQKGNYTMPSLQESETSPDGLPCKMLPEKVIIFSQFLEHIHVIEQQLTIAGIKYSGMYSPMHSSNKMKSLLIFQHDHSCMVLLMDGSAALGLDLSFVTHVFLMEPIWDRSMEEQVISRAHRMGATRPVYVETLAMHGTIEEQMLEFLQDADMNRRALSQEIDKTNKEGARAHRTLHDFAENNYLTQLTFVRTNVKAMKGIPGS